MIKPAITLSIVCPAVILAASLTERLTGLIKYAKNSITISKGAINLGAPGGKNIERNFKPCLQKAAITTTINKKAAKAKVTTIWLGAVKL